MGKTSRKISRRAKAKDMAAKRWKLKSLPSEYVNFNLENNLTHRSVPVRRK